jgi:hypothetical protein
MENQQQLPIDQQAFLHLYSDACFNLLRLRFQGGIANWNLITPELGREIAQHGFAIARGMVEYLGQHREELRLQGAQQGTAYNEPVGAGTGFGTRAPKT